jgi:hypothetical protein
MTDRNAVAHLLNAEDHRMARVDAMAWVDRYTRRASCPVCLWPFGGYGHLCLKDGAALEPTRLDGDTA